MRNGHDDDAGLNRIKPWIVRNDAYATRRSDHAWEWTSQAQGGGEPNAAGVIYHGDEERGGVANISH
jgi:hypothetical protein